MYKRQSETVNECNGLQVIVRVLDVVVLGHCVCRSGNACLLYTSIGKLKKGSSFAGCIRYVTGKDEAKILASDGVLLGTNAEICLLYTSPLP